MSTSTSPGEDSTPEIALSDEEALLLNLLHRMETRLSIRAFSIPDIWHGLPSYRSSDFPKKLSENLSMPYIQMAMEGLVKKTLCIQISGEFSPYSLTDEGRRQNALLVFRPKAMSLDSCSPPPDSVDPK